MKVRLRRVLAHYLDGVDVRNRQIGDVLDLSPQEAQLLIAERWAVPERRIADRPPPPTGDRRRDPSLPDDFPPADEPHRN
jgi:hypothetical protein